jgi:hypothetical protein
MIREAEIKGLCITLENPFSIAKAKDEIALRRPQLSQEDKDLLISLKEQSKRLVQSKPIADDTPMGVKETAALLGKNEKTIRRWTEREHHPLPVVKILQNSQYTWCFNRDEVIEWFNLSQQN